MEQVPTPSGVNGTDGTYLRASVTAADLAAIADGTVANPADVRDAKLSASDRAFAARLYSQSGTRQGQP